MTNPMDFLTYVSRRFNHGKRMPYIVTDLELSRHLSED
jgi:hypothetical protein